MELFRAEIKFESKAKLFSYILFGVAAIIVICFLVASIPNFIQISKGPTTLKKSSGPTGLVAIVIVLV